RRTVGPRHARGGLARRRRSRHRPAGVDVRASRRRLARARARDPGGDPAPAEARLAEIARLPRARCRRAAFPGLPRGGRRRDRLPAAAGPWRRSLAVPGRGPGRSARLGPGKLGAMTGSRLASRNRLRGAIAVIALAGILLVGWAGWQRFMVPRPAPDVAFQSIDGSRIELANLRGQVVMVEFWATTCVICMREMPEVAAMARELGP